MKILTVSNYYPPFYQGANEISCEATVNELARRGHQVEVLCGNWGIMEKSQSAHPTTDSIYRLLHLHSFRNLSRGKRLLAQLGKAYTSRLDYRLALRIGTRSRPDLVYVWNMGGLSMSVLSALQQLRACTVFELHDYWLLERYRNLVLEPSRLKKAYRSVVEGCSRFENLQFHSLIAISEPLKSEYVRGGFPADDFTVMRRPVPVPYAEGRSRRRDRQPSGLHLLFAGRLVREKGTHIAVQALALLAEQAPQPVYLDIAGSGSSGYLQELEHMVVAEGLGEKVRFLGMVDRSRLIDMYEEYDAVLAPSIWCEPLAQVVLEAMARGVCVIASDRGGPSEVITHEKDGLLVPAGDPQALAQAILRLSQNQQLCEDLGQAGLQTVRLRFSFQSALDELEEYLGSVVSSHQPNPQCLPLSRCT